MVRRFSTHARWLWMLSMLTPMRRVLRAANSSLRRAKAVSSVLQTGVKSAGWLKNTAQDLKKLGVIDEIIPEPKGGAHRAAGEAIRSFGLQFNAGHGLSTANVGPIAALPGLAELHIGHSIVSRAVIVGMRAAVSEIRAAIDAAASGSAVHSAR